MSLMPFGQRMKILGMSEDLARSLKEFLGTSYAFWIRLACLGQHPRIKR